MEYSGENILTKESRGAIIKLEIKGFLFILHLIPQADEKSIFRADKGMPLSLSFQESDNPFKNIRGLPLVCSGTPKNDFKKSEKMKQFIAFVLVIVLCLSLSVCAFADVDSNQGGNNGGSTTAPQTGSTAIIALAVGACAAGGISFAAYKKSGK